LFEVYVHNAVFAWIVSLSHDEILTNLLKDFMSELIKDCQSFLLFFPDASQKTLVSQSLPNVLCNELIPLSILSLKIVMKYNPDSMNFAFTLVHS
jgi:hypothetical protein